MTRRLFMIFSLAFVAGLGAGMALPSPSHAVPSFARTLGLPCSTCHTQWPLLNSFGRNFMAQGFAAGESLDISDSLSLQKGFPISARLNFRLIDKRDSKDSTNDTLTDNDKQLKLRALHEAEIFVAGRMANFSYFFELEAEDEWPDPNEDAPGFQIQFVHGYAGWHLNPAFNLRAGFASPFGPDGRNTVHRHKPGRYQWAASSKGFLPGVSQGMNAYGTVQGLFYSLAWHGNDDELQGPDPEDFSGRLAYDIAGASIGGFFSTSRKFSEPSVGKSGDRTNRFGADFQWLGQGIQLNAIYAIKAVDVTNERDHLIGVFAQYILPRDGSPWAAIAVNVDRFSEPNNTSDDDFTKGALFLTYFARENVKFQGGWEGTFQAPDAYKHKESRITLVADVGF